MKTLKTLDTLTRLAEKVAIYVPSTMDIDKKVNNVFYVQMIQKELSELFGGCTAQNVSGAWFSDSLNELVAEGITIVYSFTDKLTNEKIDEVISLCEWLKKEMTQECISLEVNGNLYFV